jgi:hypothetical protein
MSLNVGSTWHATAEDALARWNSVPAHTFSFFYDTVNRDHCARGTLCVGTDGNAVEWDNFSDGVCGDPAGSYLAVTRWNALYNDFCNADVLFNSARSWTTSARECTTTSPYNFSSVAIHEFGHVVGLDHEDDELATMNSIYHANDRRIHGDDQQGIRALYGSGSSINVMASHWERTSTSPSAPADLVEAPASPVTAGGSVTYEWTQENSGTSSATFDIGFYLSTNAFISTSDTLLGVNYGASVSAGFAFTGDRTLTIPHDTPSGTYYIGAILDYNNALAESDETDNDFEPCVATVVNGGADLDITSLDSPEPVKAGDSYEVADTVRNLGGDPSGTFRVGFYLSSNSVCSTGDIFMGYRTVSSLGRLASSSGSTSVPIPSVSPGTWYVCGIADYLGAVSELSESNNTAYDQVQVVECTLSSDCNDGLFCNGSELCISNSCVAGSPPCPGPDGDGDCSESCNEAANNCTLADPDGSACTDGLFCTGVDSCSGGSCSVHAGDPCLPGEVCDEEADICSGTPSCSDGFDNDGDGAVDYPADIGCKDPSWPTENPECDDGIDNADNDDPPLADWDGAGLGDPDPQCMAAWDKSETPTPPACGLGGELALLLPLLFWWHRRSAGTAIR